MPSRLSAAVATVVVAVAVLGLGIATAQTPPRDFTMSRAESSPGTVTFSHTSHAVVGTCTTCHAKDFKMKRGASGPITLAAKQEGKFCGACHDGKRAFGGRVAFAIDECERCHRDTPEPPTTATPPATAAAPTPPPAARTPSPSTAAKAPSAPEASECLACHGDASLKREAARPGRGPSVHVEPALLAASPHASLSCVQCHRTATVPHDATLPRVRCADCHAEPPKTLATGAHGGPSGPACTTCHGTHDIKRPAAMGIQRCAACHGREVTAYSDSIHGRARTAGDKETPTCVSCHGGSVHAARPNTDPASPVYPLRLPQTCAQCHADSELAQRHGIKAGNVYQMYMDSIHGRALSRSGLLVAANCSDCHTAHAIKPKTDNASTVFRANVPATCGRCHAGIRAEYARSIHGRRLAAGDPAVPVCTDCHSAHQIRRVDAPPWQLDVVRECGSCHEESLRTYRDTFHGQITQLGGARAAKCADCHGAHDILPAADPASRVSVTRRVETCRQCHPAANFAFTQFHPHADPHNRARFATLYWVWLGMTGLLAGTFGFFGLHTLLWLPRSLVERLRRRRHHDDESA